MNIYTRAWITRNFLPTAYTAHIVRNNIKTIPGQNRGRSPEGGGMSSEHKKVNIMYKRFIENKM